MILSFDFTGVVLLFIMILSVVSGLLTYNEFNIKNNYLLNTTLLSTLKVVDLLKMSIEAYKEDSYSNYNLIYSFGYNKNGLRAKVFRNQNKIVVAVKGTTLYFHGIGLGPTGHKDREMDNLMFGICKGEGEACLYKKKIKIDKIKYLKELENLVRIVTGVFKGDEVILTGHSLGGSLSSLISLRLSLPSIVFSSPGDKYIASVLNTNYNTRLVTHIGICEDSLFLGGCKSLCSLMGYTIDTTCHFGRALCVGYGDHPSRFLENDSLMYHRAETLLDLILKRDAFYYEVDCKGY